MSLKVYSLEDTESVPNLATRACGGIAVYPNARQGIPGRLSFYPVSLKCIAMYISSLLYLTFGVTLNDPLEVKIESRGMCMRICASTPTMSVKPLESICITFMQMRSLFTN